MNCQLDRERKIVYQEQLHLGELFKLHYFVILSNCDTLFGLIFFFFLLVLVQLGAGAADAVFSLFATASNFLVVVVMRKMYHTLLTCALLFVTFCHKYSVRDVLNCLGINCVCMCVLLQ